MGVLWPILVVAVGLAGGIAAVRLWLPPIGDDRIGDLASWVTGVLLGGAIAGVGLQAYGFLRAVRESSEFFANSDSEAFTFYATGALQVAGPMLGLAAAVYLLAMRVYGSDR
jgi:hypothetical protein